MGKQTRAEVREFLVSRRARITPRAAGLPVTGGVRRVAGLRREEVAALAGISVEYYIRLERGDAGNVSAAVLESICAALHLAGEERAYLAELLRARPCTTTTIAPVRAPVQRILDAMTTAPAVVISARLDLLGANALARALFAPMDAAGNLARFVFLDPAARTFFRDWAAIADDAASTLRADGGPHPCDRARAALVEELSAAGEFRARWARHDVRAAPTGRWRLRHPVVGDLDLPFESTPLVADPGQTLLVLPAEPGSRSADGLALLASWAAPNVRG